MGNKTMLHILLICLHIFFFLFCATSNTTKIPNGLSFKMIHRDSQDSPMYRANMTEKRRMKEYIEMSNARVRSLGRSYVPKNKSLISLQPNNDVLVRPTLSVQSLMYLVQVGIGTFGNFPKTYYLGLDTGSDLIWTQCEGCGHNCFHQVDPYYPASGSSTYRPFPCTHCPSSAQCQSNGCRFQRTYTDDSSVLAIAATEVFTFESEGGHIQPIKDVIFGCGIDMRNFREGYYRNNKISGLLGMGYGYFGFMEQTELMFDGKFSYCLQSAFGEGGGSPMYLRFGNDVPQQTPGMQTTPLYRYEDRAMYYLNLQGISVAGQRVAIPPTFFARRSGGSGGCIIDSGTATSWIVTIAYEIFESAVRAFILQHNTNVREMEKPELGFDRCYERLADPVTVNLPVITFHFENNADFVMQERAAFYIGTSRTGNGMFCMSFFESTSHVHDDVTYLGVLQQVNQRIVYDTKNSLLHFGQADCSREN